MPRVTVRLHSQDTSRIYFKPDHEPHPTLLDFAQARETVDKLLELLAEHDVQRRIPTREVSQ